MKRLFFGFGLLLLAAWGGVKCEAQTTKIYAGTYKSWSNTNSSGDIEYCSTGFYSINLSVTTEPITNYGGMTLKSEFPKDGDYPRYLAAGTMVNGTYYAIMGRGTQYTDRTTEYPKANFQFGTYDFESNTFSKIRTMTEVNEAATPYKHLHRVSDMTYDKTTNTLYAISTTGSAPTTSAPTPSTLYSINLTTGEFKELGSFAAVLAGIAADATGTLYAIGGPAGKAATSGTALYKLTKDGETYTCSLYKNVKASYGTYTNKNVTMGTSNGYRSYSIEFDPNGTLYWLVYFSTSNYWGTIDLASEGETLSATLRKIGTPNMVGLFFDEVGGSGPAEPEITDITVNGKSIGPVEFDAQNQATYTLDYGFSTYGKPTVVVYTSDEKSTQATAPLTWSNKKIDFKFTIGSKSYTLTLAVKDEIETGAKTVAIENYYFTAQNVTDLNNADANLTVIDLTNCTEVDSEDAGELDLQNPNCLIFTKPNAKLSGAGGKHVNQVVYDSGTYTAEDIQLTDGTNFRNPHAFTAKKVSYKRTFTPSTYGTFCLPYAMKVSELGLADGEVVEKLESIDPASSVITFTELNDEEVLEPNTAYLIANNATHTAKTFGLDKGDTYGITVSEVSDTIPSSTCFRANMVEFTMPADPNLYKLNASQNLFTHSAGNAKIPAFRGYLDLNTATPLSSLRVKHITRGTGEEGGGATAIADTPAASSVWMEEGTLYVRAAEELLVPVYTLDGRLVCWLHVQPNQPASVALERGTYLVAGQKVVW